MAFEFALRERERERERKNEERTIERERMVASADGKGSFVQVAKQARGFPPISGFSMRAGMCAGQRLPVSFACFEEGDQGGARLFQWSSTKNEE